MFEQKGTERTEEGSKRRCRVAGVEFCEPPVIRSENTENTEGTGGEGPLMVADEKEEWDADERGLGRMNADLLRKDLNRRKRRERRKSGKILGGWGRVPRAPRRLISNHREHGGHSKRRNTNLR